MTNSHNAPPVRSRSQTRRWLYLNAWLLALVGLLAMSYPVEELSRRMGDLYFRLRGTQATSPYVALVLIDDASLDRYGRWPWKRSLLAQAVRAVSAAKPKVIGLDILLSEAEDKSDDQELARAIKEAENAVLIAKISNSQEGRFWVEPLPLFVQGAAAVGHAQAALGPDGICRSIPVRELSIEGPRWAFALEIARIFRGGKLTCGGNELRLSDTTIPTVGRPAYPQLAGVESEAPRLLPIDYRGQTTPGENPQPFVAISVKDLLEGQGNDQLRGKAVLIGFGSTEISDRLSTPVSGNLPMPGVEIHANLADALLSGRTLRPVPGVADVLLLLGFALSSTWAVLRWPGWRGILGLAAFLAGILAGGYILFAKAHLLVPLGPLLCLAILAGPMAQLQNLLIADRGVTARLRELERVLRLPRSESDGTLPSALQREASASSGSLSWKIELLSQLQAELSSLYAFDQTLLESMQEALAVFANDGRLVFRNPRWQSFCERHRWNPSCRLEEFAEALDEPVWRNLPESLAQPGARLNGEVHIGDGLWQLTAVRLKAIEPGNPSEMILVVATDQTARLERDRARAEALGFVTHELRTPLVSIQGFAEYLLRYPEKAGKSEAATTIFRESGRLVAMINTYLDVLRMESGAQPLKRELVQVRDLVGQVNRVVQPLAEAAEITVNTEIASSLPSLEGDPNLIAGALLNLMSNAVKYSPHGSSVKLRALPAEGSIVLEVCNPGPIIPPSELQRLFEPFYRREEQESSVSGWGLGLAFVRRIAEQHGGQVEASSDPITGTCFRLRLPATRVHLSEGLQ